MRHDPTSIDAVDNGCIFPTVSGIGRWEALDCEGGPINIRWFGAVGDGVADDTDAILAALEKVGDRASLFVPEGRFVVTQPLPLADRLHVHGNGDGSMIAVQHSGAGWQNPTPATRLYEILIRDLAINTAGGARALAAITLTNVSYARIENVMIHAFAGKGFQYGIKSWGDSPAGGAWSSSIIGNRIYAYAYTNGPAYAIHGSGGPAWGWGPNSWRILDNYLNIQPDSVFGGVGTNEGTAVVYIENVNGPIVSGNIFEGYYTNAVVFTNASAFTISENRFEHAYGSGGTNFVAINLLSVTNATMSGNMMQGLGDKSSVVQPSTASVTIIDPSWGGPHTIDGNLLVGNSWDFDNANFLPPANDWMLVESSLSSNKLAVGVRNIDGTNNPRAVLYLNADPNPALSHAGIFHAGSLVNIPFYFTGSSTNLTITPLGTAVLGLTVSGAELTTYGDIAAGTAPSLWAGSIPSGPLLSITGTTNTETVGFVFGIQEPPGAPATNNLRLAGGARGPSQRTYLQSLSSVASPPLDIMVGVTTGAVFTTSGASVLGHPVSGAELTVFGDIYAGPNPNAWAGSKLGDGNFTITSADTNSMPSVIVGHQGGANSRVELVTSNLLARLVATSSAGAIPLELWSGSQRVAKFDATDGLVIDTGLPFSIGGESFTDISGTNLIVAGNKLNVYGLSAEGHTHDASNTVSGQFESARLGSGTSDTDTFLRGGEPPTWDQLSADDIPNLPASRITSGTFDSARMGTGTATTNTFLQGDGSGGAFWGTVPSTPSPTNGIADAPADGIFYGRLNNAWTQPDISDLSGVSGWGLAWIDGTVVDDVDALTTLGLLGGGPTTIDSPAKYAVRVGSGGTVSTRHRLNMIASTGLTLAISDDAINDESDVTVSIADRDWGDITSTSSGSVWNIDADAVGSAEIATGAVGTTEVDDNAVTYAKIQNVTASRVLGRGAGAGDGDPQELTIGDGLAMTGTSIHTNPVVVSASKLIGRGSASGSGAAEEITLGTGLTMTGTTLSAASSGPTLLGWASFAVDPSYAMVSVSSGGSVTNVTGNTLSNSDAMEVTLEFSGGPHATTYHVTADIEGTDDATDASYLPKWWIKQGGKQSTGVVVKACGWDQYAAGASTPLGFTWTFWVWARE